jgi:hypothetical protein
MVPANKTAAPPVSSLEKVRRGVRTYLCHGVRVSVTGA